MEGQSSLNQMQLFATFMKSSALVHFLTASLYLQKMGINKSHKLVLFLTIAGPEALGVFDTFLCLSKMKPNYETLWQIVAEKNLRDMVD